MMKPFKAAAFDVDGILLDTEGMKYNSWVEALRKYGTEKLSIDEYREYAGMGEEPEIARRIVERRGMNADPSALSEERNVVLKQAVMDEDIDLMPYAREAMEYCRGRGLWVSVVTSSPRDELVRKVKRVGLWDLVHFTVSSDDVKRKKSDPEPYLRALRCLKQYKPDISAEEWVAFEDTESGIVSAKSAGMIAVAIPNVFSIGQNFSAADFVARDLREVVEWMERTSN